MLTYNKLRKIWKEIDTSAFQTIVSKSMECLHYIHKHICCQVIVELNWMCNLLEPLNTRILKVDHI